MALIYPLSQFITVGSTATGIVPFFGLNQKFHYLILYLVIPLVFSVLFAIVSPIVLTPLFMKLKNKIWYNYTNGYVELKDMGFDVKKFVKRLIYILLLTLGIQAIILDFTNLDLFVSPEQKQHLVVELGLDLKYTPDIFLGVDHSLLKSI